MRHVITRVLIGVAGGSLAVLLTACVSVVKPLGAVPAFVPSSEQTEAPAQSASGNAVNESSEDAVTEPLEEENIAAPQTTGSAAPEIAAASTTPGRTSIAAAAPSAGPAPFGPATDPGTIETAGQISDLPLAAQISDAASQPARAASLRVVEKARKQMLGGDSEAATRSLSRAISIDPSDPYAYFYLGRAYFLRRDYSQALTFLRRAEIGFASNPAWLSETLGFEGACLELAGRATEAAAVYKRALDSTPGNLMARAGFTRLGDLASVQPPIASATPPEATEAPADIIAPSSEENSAIAPPPAMAPPPPPPAAAVPPPAF